MLFPYVFPSEISPITSARSWSRSVATTSRRSRWTTWSARSAWWPKRPDVPRRHGELGRFKWILKWNLIDFCWWILQYTISSSKLFTCICFFLTYEVNIYSMLIDFESDNQCCCAGLINYNKDTIFHSWQRTSSGHCSTRWRWESGHRSGGVLVPGAVRSVVSTFPMESQGAKYFIYIFINISISCMYIYIYMNEYDEFYQCPIYVFQAHQCIKALVRFWRNGQEAVPHADEAADDQGGHEIPEVFFEVGVQRVE